MAGDQAADDRPGGVNVIVAATFVAAVGDIRRFPDRRKLAACLGLTRACAGPATARLCTATSQGRLIERAPRSG